MWRTAGILVFLILCLSVVSVGFQNSFALSQPSVKATVDGKAVVFEIRNPKSNSVPIYQLKMVADTGILSGKPPSGWLMKRQTTLVYSDTAVFFSSSNPLAAGKSAQFAYTSAGLSTSITWYAYDKSAKLVAQGTVKTPFYKILNGLQHNDLAMLDVYSAFKNADFTSGKDSIRKARDSLFQTRADYEIIKYDFAKSDRKSIETVLNNEDKTIAFVERALFLFEQALTLADEIKGVSAADSEKVIGVAKETELLGYSFLKVSDDANSMSSDLTVSLKDPLIKEIYTRRGYDTRALVATFSSLGTSAKSTGQDILSAVSRIYQAYDITSSVKDTEIPSEKKATNNNSDLVPSDLAKFFDTFDKDHDKKIDLTEAQAFYNWVELNIAYRYDDENEKDPVQGTVVGDSRKGVDYRQTPYETYKERAGDCEDMATLEQAFYNHFGIAAYTIGVNTVAKDAIDHAATIVLISGTVDDYKNTLGNLVYYDYSDGGTDVYGKSIPKGVYMLVDNAYSDAFGYLSGGLEEGTFTASCVIPLDKGYGGDWASVVHKCSISFD